MLPGFTFDQERGEALKKKGMEKALAGANQSLLERVRQAVREIAVLRNSREASGDDARRWLESNGYNSGSLGMAMGSLFKNGEWLPTGRTIKTEVATSHARPIMVWRLK